jgi:xanthine dehydrogenase accessory factor
VSGSLDGADVEIYLEPFLSKPKLVIAGAGHIGKATAHLGALMGFEVIVIDDRPSLACKENLPDAAQTICGDIPSEMAQLATNDQTYVVIVTRGHRHDGTVLAAAVKKPSAFIGMIGSRRKGLMIRRGLIEEGLATESELDQVCSPIGVDIGSVTVPEIALSIVTQLVAVRRKRQWGAPAMNYGLEDYSHRPRGGTGSTDGATEAAPTVGR